jgi:hypothetical protein
MRGNRVNNIDGEEAQEDEYEQEGEECEAEENEEVSFLGEPTL